jgi:serine-type D-Ala-D-Ala endopeptidase (penicillin-binding protein 7)
MKVVFLLLICFTVLAVNAQQPSASTVVFNQTKNEFVVEDQADRVRPIASITKVMTAIVALDHYELDRLLDTGYMTKLPPGKHTVESLLTATLVRSDNGASEILAQNYPGGRSAFLTAMNRRAQNLGAVNMKFHDPTGLSAKNVATAREVVLLMQESLNYPFIGAASTLKQAIFEHQTRKTTRKVILPNTNKPLLYDYEEILSSKTGFTNAAGWNVGLMLERQGQRFTVVILGARTKEHRYTLARALIETHFKEIDTEILAQELKQLYNKEKKESRWDKLRNWFENF